MNIICDCETYDESVRRADCDDCGSACCRGCRIEVDDQTYCRWCAAAFVAA